LKKKKFAMRIPISHLRREAPENQNFYIIQHGIRLSGMPANVKRKIRQMPTHRRFS